MTKPVNRSAWAVLVGGMNWGRGSPSVLQEHSAAWHNLVGAPATMKLCDDSHCLRVCRRMTKACATIRRRFDHSVSAQLIFHGGGGMVRVNDHWIQEEGEVVDLCAGDLIELICLEHPPMRVPNGWYTAVCAERRGGHPVAQTWRFVPEEDSFRMLSPCEEVKSFFPTMSELQGPPTPGKPCECVKSDHPDNDFCRSHEGVAVAPNAPRKRQRAGGRGVRLRLTGVGARVLCADVGAGEMRTRILEPLPLPEAGHCWVDGDC